MKILEWLWGEQMDVNITLFVLQAQFLLDVYLNSFYPKPIVTLHKIKILVDLVLKKSDLRGDVLVLVTSMLSSSCLNIDLENS